VFKKKGGRKKTEKGKRIESLAIFLERSLMEKCEKTSQNESEEEERKQQPEREKEKEQGHELAVQMAKRTV